MQRNQPPIIQQFKEYRQDNQQAQTLEQKTSPQKNDKNVISSDELEYLQQFDKPNKHDETNQRKLQIETSLDIITKKDTQKLSVQKQSENNSIQTDDEEKEDEKKLATEVKPIKKSISFKNPTPVKKAKIAPNVMIPPKLLSDFERIEKEKSQQKPSIKINSGTLSASKSAYSSIIAECDIFNKSNISQNIPKSSAKYNSKQVSKKDNKVMGFSDEWEDDDEAVCDFKGKPKKERKPRKRRSTTTVNVREEIMTEEGFQKVSTKKKRAQKQKKKKEQVIEEPSVPSEIVEQEQIAQQRQNDELNLEESNEGINDVTITEKDSQSQNVVLEEVEIPVVIKKRKRKPNQRKKKTEEATDLANTIKTESADESIPTSKKQKATIQRKRKLKSEETAS